MAWLTIKREAEQAALDKAKAKAKVNTPRGRR
jgi:hypothetical protein